MKIVIAFSAMVAAFGCAPQATLPPDTFDPVRIGVVTSMTGALGTDGAGWADAARLAALEINAAGGPLPGRLIEIVVIDDGTRTDAEELQHLAARVVDEEFVGVVGAAASSITLGLARLATPAQIPQISCCSTSDDISAFNRALAAEERYLFRTSPPDGLQSVVVAIAAAEPPLSCTRLAILHVDDAYGQPFAAGIEAAFAARGGVVAAIEPCADEQASYVTELGRISAAAPDCVALVAYPGSGGTIMRNWATLSGRPAVTWIGTDGVRAPGFVDQVGDPALIEGFYGTSPVTDAPTPEYNAFADRFRAVFGVTPIPFSSNQYDATALLALAIAQAGTTDGSDVRDALREVAAPPSDRGLARAGRLRDALAEIRGGRDIDYQGASGDTDFDEIGDVVTDFEIWRYDGPATTPCDGATLLGGGRGSFCRFRTLNAGDIAP